MNLWLKSLPMYPCFWAGFLASTPHCCWTTSRSHLTDWLETCIESVSRSSVLSTFAASRSQGKIFIELTGGARQAALPASADGAWFHYYRWFSNWLPCPVNPIHWWTNCVGVWFLEIWKIWVQAPRLLANYRWLHLICEFYPAAKQLRTKIQCSRRLWKRQCPLHLLMHLSRHFLSNHSLIRGVGHRQWRMPQVPHPRRTRTKLLLVTVVLSPPGRGRSPAKIVATYSLIVVWLL